MSNKLLVSNCPGWQAIPHVRLGISMNNANFTGERLGALLDWVQANGKTLTLQVTDSLNHHNNGGDRDAARAMGDAWLKDNAPVLARVNYTLVRWDDLTGHPDFALNKARVHILYENHQPFAHAVNDYANRFAARRPGRDPAASIAFVLEEAAGYASVWQGEPHIKLYPSKPEQWWNLAKENLAAPTPAEHWAKFRFR
jgi:tRNA-dependent cyclodipeptide synthase